eukprot:ctg_953.g224
MTPSPDHSPGSRRLSTSCPSLRNGNAPNLLLPPRELTDQNSAPPPMLDLVVRRIHLPKCHHQAVAASTHARTLQASASSPRTASRPLFRHATRSRDSLTIDFLKRHPARLRLSAPTRAHPARLRSPEAPPLRPMTSLETASDALASDGARVRHFQEALQCALVSIFDECGTTDHLARALREWRARTAVSTERLAELRAQMVDLVTTSMRQELDMALEELGVRGKLNRLDQLCEQQLPLVDGRRHLPPAPVLPEAAVRTLRVQRKQEAHERLAELVAEEEHKLRALETEADGEREALERTQHELDTAMRALNQWVQMAVTDVDSMDEK